MTLPQLKKKYQDNKTRLVEIDKELLKLQREKATLEAENNQLVADHPAEFQKADIHRPLTKTQSDKDEAERKKKSKGGGSEWYR